MILVWLVLIPFLGGVLAWAAQKALRNGARWIALLSLFVELLLAAGLLWGRPNSLSAGAWIAEIRFAWIPELGITFHLAADGISLLLVALTAFLGIMAVLSTGGEVSERIGFFHFTLLGALTGITGVFLAVDLFLFYFFWEIMLLPMFLLIALWGHENRRYASIKFFIFTQFGGLLMLAAMVGLFLVHGQATGYYTFDYKELIGSPMPPGLAMVLMCGFLAAFLVKLPAVPFHVWLADAHTEAPTAASVILAGLLLKTGGYGLIRFIVPLFPEAAARFSPIAMMLGAAGIIYGAALAYAQTDMKRLVACTSISHMGFVLLGVFAWNLIALQGVMIQMICHGISTGALFMLSGVLREETGTLDFKKVRGFWTGAPRMGGFLLFFAMASMGLPGLGNFVGEFLVLLGVYNLNPVFAVIASGGFILATLYSTILVKRVLFDGAEERDISKITDLRPRELVLMTVLSAAIIWIGLFPRPFTIAIEQGLRNIEGCCGEEIPEGAGGSFVRYWNGEPEKEGIVSGVGTALSGRDKVPKPVLISAKAGTYPPRVDDEGAPLRRGEAP